jgi:hypothetical protein
MRRHYIPGKYALKNGLPNTAKWTALSTNYPKCLAWKSRFSPTPLSAPRKV